MQVGHFGRRYFINKMVKFVWNNHCCQFEKLRSGINDSSSY